MKCYMDKNKRKHYEAVKRYNRKNIKTYALQLNRKTDQDIIGWLEKCRNKNGYIKTLIRNDMIEYEKHGDNYDGYKGFDAQ